MPVLKEILSENTNLSLRQIKALTDWDDSVAQDYVSKQTSINALAFSNDEIEQKVLDNESNLDHHTSSHSEHGVNGDNVGTEDYAASGIAGVVLLADEVENASQSSANVSTPSASTAPAAYSQTQMQGVVSLVNSIKTQHNNAIDDLNATIDQLNAIIASMKTAKQMDD